MKGELLMIPDTLASWRSMRAFLVGCCCCCSLSAGSGAATSSVSAATTWASAGASVCGLAWDATLRKVVAYLVPVRLVPFCWHGCVCASSFRRAANHRPPRPLCGVLPGRPYARGCDKILAILLQVMVRVEGKKTMNGDSVAAKNQAKTAKNSRAWRCSCHTRFVGNTHCPHKQE